MKKCAVLSVAILALVSARALAVSWYTAPNGGGTMCSLMAPCPLAFALGASSPAQPGDTIWLRGGTYAGTFTSSLNGTANAPIVVRQYPGERATIDGGNSNGVGIFSVSGSYTWFWGFEVMSSYGNRVTDYPLYGQGVQTDQGSPHPGLKFINMVVHDTRQGFSLWLDATDMEMYGSLSYYNGWVGTDRGHGHGIYTQNQTGTKAFRDNIVFQNFDHGSQAYGSSAAYLNNLRFEGNTILQNGEPAGSGGRNFLIGGGRVAENPVVTSNYFYRNFDGTEPSSDFDMGYSPSTGCSNPVVTDNYVASGTMFFNCTTNLTMSGNTFYGYLYGFSPSSYPDNTYHGSTRPTGVRVFVRPNVYEPGRGNVTIYNWDLDATVSVDLSSVLSVGSSYEVRNAQNFFGSPVLTGVYAGGSVPFPMTGLSQAAPVGFSTPVATGPEFNVFVVLTTAGGMTPTPTPVPPSATATRTPTGPLPTVTPTPTRTRTPTPIIPPGHLRKTRTPNGRH